MELTFECSKCEATATVPDVESSSSAVCACGASHGLRPGSVRGGQLEFCSWCTTGDLYTQKDFPHGLGLSIVFAGFVVSCIFWFYYMPILTLATLLATAALDLVLYQLVPDVTICYRCLGQYRGPGSNIDRRFVPFDLAIGERYRQERLRIEELRRRQASADAAPPH